MLVERAEGWVADGGPGARGDPYPGQGPSEQKGEMLAWLPAPPGANGKESSSGPKPRGEVAAHKGWGSGRGSCSLDRKSTRLNSSHRIASRMPSSA